MHSCTYLYPRSCIYTCIYMYICIYIYICITQTSRCELMFEQPVDQKRNWKCNGSPFCWPLRWQPLRRFPLSHVPNKSAWCSHSFLTPVEGEPSVSLWGARQSMHLNHFDRPPWSEGAVGSPLPAPPESYMEPDCEALRKRMSSFAGSF